MKQKLLLILMFLCASVSFGQPVLGQPTGPSTMPYPADPNSWSMTDPWVVSGHLTLVNAVPGTADQPLIVWGMDGLLAGAGSLNSYLTPYAKTSSVNTALAGKMNIPSGTSAQYVNGTGGLTTFPSIPSQVNLSAGANTSITGTYPNLTVSNTAKVSVNYTGTTNASGVYSVTYPTAYASTPNVQGIFVTSDPRDVIMLTSSNTTGFSFIVQRRVDVVGLLPSYTNQSNVRVNVLVTPI